MTVAECARSAVDVLVATGAAREDARRDVAALARHVLGWDEADWLIRQQDAAPEALAALESLVARRATGEPVAYLTGTREFYGRAFIVTPDVLIPRPETELLVERALAAIDAVDGARALTVIDIGTGSGCIAVTLAAERPSLQLVATDTSGAALAVAAANAARHHVADRVALRAGSLTAGASAADLIVSNPPYVGLAERDGLMRDVREFEPASALFAGGDGLDVIRALVPEAAAALRPGGAFLIEIGAGQARSVGDLMSAAGFEAVQVRRDLAGLPRVVEGRRPDSSV